MNKNEFIDAVSKAAGLTKKDSESAVNAFTQCMTELLAKGDSITLPGFAGFSVKTMAARTGRNPATGEIVNIAASKKVSFKTGSKLKEAINT